MEGFQWLRIGGIAALVLASIYLLLPTFLGESAAQQAAEAAGGVTQQSRTRADTDFELRVLDGDPAAVAEFLERRFQVAGVELAGVSVDGGLIKLVEGSTTNSAVAKALATSGGDASVFEPAVFGELPAKDAPPALAPGTQGLSDALRNAEVADAAYWAAVLGNLHGRAVPPGADAGWSVASASSSDEGVTVVLEPPGAQATPRVLAIGGEAFGVVVGDQLVR